MQVDFKELVNHDMSEECPICRAQELVETALVPAAAAWEIATSKASSVTLVMAGRNNHPAREDEAVAAEILAAMPGTIRMRSQAPRRSRALEADFFASESGQNLVRLGYVDDIRHCATLNSSSLVPILDGKVLVPRKGDAT